MPTKKSIWIVLGIFVMVTCLLGFAIEAQAETMFIPMLFSHMSTD
jgi:hypothetical protein